MVANIYRQIPQIGGHADLGAFHAKGETHRIGRVVGNGEGFHLNIANLKAMPRFKALELFQLRPLAVYVRMARAQAACVAPVMKIGMRSFLANVAKP